MAPTEKLFALVVDDQPLQPVAFDMVERLPQHRQRVVVDGVHLACGIRGKHAVADVPERGGAVRFHRLAPALDVGEQQHALGARTTSP